MGNSTPSNATPRATDIQVPSKASTSIPTPTAAGEAVPSSSEGEFMPSAEAIIKSTTSRSKPLKALERMRRFNRTNVALERVTGGGSGNPAARSGHGAVGTMDVFTVLQEVNEQMGRALDLQQLLDVVVGIIKDLTQFHRVLCYQFDDAWNGQVVAELVDWNQTRELFMGLHFPASDIPAQVYNNICAVDACP
jgi:hypothetical protein